MRAGKILVDTIALRLVFARNVLGLVPLHYTYSMVSCQILYSFFLLFNKILKFEPVTFVLCKPLFTLYNNEIMYNTYIIIRYLYKIPYFINVTLVHNQYFKDYQSYTRSIFIAYLLPVFTFVNDL